VHHTIEVSGLAFSYPDGRAALRGVDLHIGPGEKVALVGPNGAGKSTLMLHLNGILQPTSGSVTVCGLPIRKETLGRVRAAVGLVFQDPEDQLFSATVYEDVAFGPVHMGLPEPEVRDRVARALAAVHMSAYGTRVPYHLSAGEKKRIAIATVLSMDPEILVLDEPASGLDARGRRGLIALLRDLPQTMLVATHDLRLAGEVVTRTVVIDDGRIVADGPSDRILGDPALLGAHGLEVY
jgi:cobalt transport protein ATP-binding subunit